MDDPTLDLTILMPCLNEAESVGECVREARAYLERSGLNGEVLVVDNGSSDGSAEIARSRGARVVSESRPGYGNAVSRGIRESRGALVIMGDADGSYSFEDLDPFVERLQEGNDLVMGNRFRGSIARGAMPLLHRYLGNPVLSGIGRMFFRSPVGDFHCGLRGMRREAIARLGLGSGGMEYASEMVVRATLDGLRIGEVPATLAPASRSRPPHLRTWRDGWRHLRYLLLLSPRWLFLYPGLAFTLAGLATMVWLLPGPRTVGSVTLDVNTLVYAGAALSLGVQALTFAVLAKAYGIARGLLPTDERVTGFLKRPILEVGLGAGIVLVLVGLAVGTYAVGLWGRANFGDLDPVRSLRLVVPSATALVLGTQACLAGFLFALLDLGESER